MEYKVSVIVPAYNSENTLPGTLDCLLGQSIHNETEIIPVNDGSTDKTAEIIAEYAGKHSNIFPVNKENGGVSSARNAGLEKARGKYVLFLDADDLITENTLESVYDSLGKTGADCAVFRLSRFGFGGSEYNPVTQELAKEESISYDDKRLLWTFLIGNKCFRRRAVLDSGALFPPTAYCEDGVFWVRFLMRNKAKVMGVYGGECRYRRQDPCEKASVTQTMKPSLVDDFFKSCGLILDELESNELIEEMRLKICRTVTNEFYRRLWQADDGILKTLESGYNKYKAILSPESVQRLREYDADIGEPVFSREKVAANPKISVSADRPTEEFLLSLYSQTMPLFELVTNNAGSFDSFENVNHGKAKAPVEISFKGNEKLDPRMLRAVLLLKSKAPFMPCALLKKAAETYLKSH